MTAARPRSPLRRAVDGAALAVTFLTVLPLPVASDHDGARAAPAFFPLVGAGVGAAAGAVFAAGRPVFGATVAAVLCVAALVIVTGGLHQDGLADCADGMGVRGDRQRRLGVMREPAVGTFGALALVLWALLLTSALRQMDAREAIGALAAAAAIGRWAALVHARLAAPARTDGLGASFRPAGLPVLVAGLSAVLVVAVADPEAPRVLVVTTVGVAAAGVVSVWSRRTLGGRTGDTLGAAVALAELAALLAQLGFMRG